MKRIFGILLGLSSIFLSSFSLAVSLQKQPSFFRFDLTDVAMPQSIPNMGLLGIHYNGFLNDFTYVGVGALGSVSGSQGGLFVLGGDGGVKIPVFSHFLLDAGLYVGGGGGRSSLVGGGLVLNPYVGFLYDTHFVKLGLNYSVISFPSGKIHSRHVGMTLDIPYDFYYTQFNESQDNLLTAIHLITEDAYWIFSRNDFGILLDQYYQQKGTKNVNHEIQDNTIHLVGAELDHYLTEHSFWYLKARGAYQGIPNGYMDLVGGMGYHANIQQTIFSLVPKLGIGAGGGGNVNTGGGILIEPQVGLEGRLIKTLSLRFNGGYLWAPDGKLRAKTAELMLIYHLDVIRGTKEPTLMTEKQFLLKNWEIVFENQTYVSPTRTFDDRTSPISLVVVELQQYLNSYLFLTYQAASAYSGFHAGGLATGMVGLGIKSEGKHVKCYGQLLVGAAGGGALTIGNGSVYEPLVGVEIPLTKAWGLSVSAGELQSFSGGLHTPVINVGFNLRFGTVNAGNYQR